MTKFTCPGCGSQYRLPEGAAGKRVRCKKCGKITQILDDDDDGPIRLAGEPDDFFAEAAAAASRTGPPPTADLPCIARPSADSGAHAVEEADALVAAGRISDTRPAGRTFWSDVGWSFLFITQPGNLVTFAFVWLMYMGTGLVLFAPCVGLFAWFILTGWILSFLLNCTIETASGEDDLPSLRFTEGVWDDIVLPIIKFVGTSIVLAAPAFIYLFIALGLASQGLLSAFQTATRPGDLLSTAGAIAVPFFFLAATGIFLWPITILVVAMSRLADAFRIDLILASGTLASACTASTIDPEPRKLERPSDHAPVIAEFR